MGLESSKLPIVKRHKHSEGDALTWGIGEQQDKQVWGVILDGVLDSQTSSVGHFGNTWGIHYTDYIINIRCSYTKFLRCDNGTTM